jgi:hypothetical protein
MCKNCSLSRHKDGVQADRTCGGGQPPFNRDEVQDHPDHQHY